MAKAKITEQFENLDELLATIEKRPVNESFRQKKSGDKKQLSSRTGSKSFCETSSYEEAVELMKNGWDKPLAKLKMETSKMQAKANVKTSKYIPQSGVVGFAPIVPNAIMGLPNSMIHYNKTPQKVKAVTIVFGSSVNCGWETDEIIEASTVALQIVHELELMGYRVKLMLEGFAARADSNFARYTVGVKDWRQPIDLKKLAFIMAHPSMFRRISFAWLETVPDLPSSFCWGYGRPVSNESYESILKQYRADKMIGESDYYLTPSLIRDCNHDVEKVMERAGMIELRKAAS